MHKSYPESLAQVEAVVAPRHDPVLLTECIQYLNLKPGMTVVDCTLGLGGHSCELLKAVSPGGHLYAFEKDERNLKVAQKRLEEVAKEVGGKFTIFHDSFSSLTDRLKREGASRADAILFDLGLSSPHVDDAERGFSFLKEGPLDMRFDPRQTKTAADVLNIYTEKELADVFFYLGEERASRKLAAAVIHDRKEKPFTSTLQFAEFVSRVLGKGKPGRHRATQIFQALRMEVNEELMALELGLNQAIELLAPHGRVVVLSYHSLEDRFVKRTFKQFATDLRDPTDIFGARVLRLKSLSLLTKKPIVPSQEENIRNSRSRSAILRAAEKL